MEKINCENFPEGADSVKVMKEPCSSDVPADEIEDDRVVETDNETGSESSSDSSSDSDSDSEYECKVCNKTITGYLPFKQHQKGKKHAKAVLKKKKEKKLQKKNDAETTESDEEQLVQEPYAECNICKKEFYGPEAYEQHLKSKKHKQKVLEASILEQVKEEGKINVDKLRDLCKTKRTSDHVFEDVKEKMASLALDEEGENNEGEFECKDCEKLFTGLIPYAQHLMSKTHLKKREQKNLLHKIIPGSSKGDNIHVKSELDDANTLCIEDDVLVCKSCSTSFSGPENALVHVKSKNHAKKLEKYLRKLEKRKEKKRSKDTNVSSSKEKLEHEGHVETTKEEFQSSPDGPDGADVPTNSEKKSVKSSTSCNEVNETLVSYGEYKEYKAMMNSFRDDEV